MNDESTEKLVSWQVVVNHEEQYSIWPTHRPLPVGWRAEGKPETRDQCLNHIAAVWTDMRPRSLRGEVPGTAIESWADLAELIVQQAVSIPAATAVVSGGTRLGYRELSDRAAQLAHHLRSLRVLPGSMVGVALERSVDQIVAALAIMHAGGVYVPLDCSYPAQRLAAMLEETGPHVLISRSDLLGILPATAARTVLVDHEAERIGRYPAEPPSVPRHPDDMAYVVFTSGSSGRPKAVMNTRRGMLNRLLWQQRACQLRPGDAVLQLTPLGFDVSIVECFWALLAGARIVVAGPDGHRDPCYLGRLIRAEQVTVAHFVPSVLQVFLETANLADCRSLRLVIVGGEVLSADLQRRFFASGLRAELDNMYGPAEAAIAVSRWRCRRHWTSATVPIGHPIDGVRIYVLGPDGTPVPTGADGEIYIGGDQVARGYLGQPAQTAERFLPDPFAADAGSRLYRSGDRARYRPDGALEFLGRIDEQIKLRGVRIDPGEVEAAISAQPDVRACAVAADGNGVDAVLVAYIVGDAEPSQVRRRVAGMLPPAMVPGRFVRLPALPLSPNGKLDRAALPTVAASDPGIGAGPPPAAPPGAVSAGENTDRQLSAIWGEVLGLAPIGSDQPIADLGANSLHAARVLARIHTRLGAAVSLSEVFHAETVAELAQLVDQRRSREQGVQPTAAQLPLLRRDPGTSARISPGQRRLWFLDHLSAPAGTAYNVPVALRLRGSLDVPALRAALHDLVDHHEQLRTCFPLTDGGPVAQVVDEPVYPALPVVDLSGRRADDALHLAGELAAAHFDLAQAPLLRCAVFRLAADDHLLVTVYHHMIADGWTVNVFDRDLAEAYQSRVAREPSALPGLGLEYRDFARWQGECAELSDWGPQLGWWRRQLTGAPVTLDLPADRRRPAVSGYRGRRMIRPVPAGLLGRIRRLAATTRTTPYAVCVTAFGVLVRELCGHRDLLVASPAAGRPDPALDNVAGFFANTLPVRVRPGEESFRECVRHVHAMVIEALDHQYVPFERLVAEFVPSRDLAYPPLVQVAFAYQGPRRPNARLAGLAAEPVAIDNGTAKFDLTVEVSEVDEELEAVIEYSTDLFEPQRAEGMLGRFLEILSAAVESPDTAVPGLIADAAADHRAAERGPERADRCLHEIFAGTAARFPDRIAVSDGQRQLTYAELDQAANRLANRLRRQGAGPGQLVGLCAERTADLVVGVLAVLKSGAGYLPLDPGHPPARLQFMLQDAGCRLLLGDEERCQALLSPGVMFVRLGGPASPDSPEAPAAGARPRDIAYVIYTSGSTGTPKGVAVTHANVARLFTATADDIVFSPDDVWALFHSIAFDFSVWELWGPLLHGGRLAVVPFLTSRDPAAVLGLLRREGVTVLNQTPTAFRQLAAAAEDAGFPPLSLRLVVFGGEALNPSSLRGWIAGYGLSRPRLVNMYGITETTVHVTIHKITMADIQASVSPIGRPIGDLDVYVLDEELNEVPAGTEGEMYIGGPGVALGYHHRPALTAERFVAGPFGPPGGRLYRSGDLAIRHSGGDLEYRGRRDDQVKLHGFRIELGEIERVLFDQPGVREAACMLREDTPGHVRLVAYLVPQPGEVIVPSELRAAAAALLPPHMVPAIFVGVPSLPVTANGKLDRSRLPQPRESDIGGAETATGPGQAATAMERALCAVWSRVLSTDVRNVGENFFSLGGDSIIAIRLAAEIRAAGLPVTVEQIFRYPTIGALAAECGSHSREAGAGPGAAAGPASLPGPDPAALPADVASAYPMTAMQLGIMYECELAGDADSAGLFQDLISVQLEGRLDRSALDQALATITARHEIMRTSFDMVSFAEPMQMVHRDARVTVTAGTGPAEAGAVGRQAGAESPADVADGWWLSQRSIPFDFTTPPLVRCHVQGRSAGSFELSLLVHHIVLDGWSLARLMTELLLEYDSQLGGTERQAPAAPHARFHDFVAAERSAVADPGAQAFWRKMATSPVPAPLPVLGRGKDAMLPLDFAIPADLDVGLQQAAQNLGLPLKSIFFAAHLWALHALTGQADVASGLQVNGRLDEQGADQVLGLMLNVVPVRAAVTGGTWSDLAGIAFAAEQECQRYRRFPLARIQQEAGPGRRLFEAVFNYTDFHVFNGLSGLANIHCRALSFYDLHTFPLMIEVTRSPDRNSRKITVSAGIGSTLAGTGARAGELIVLALRDIAGNPEAHYPCKS